MECVGIPRQHKHSAAHQKGKFLSGSHVKAKFCFVKDGVDKGNINYN
jgi:hypothetical protein